MPNLKVFSAGATRGLVDALVRNPSGADQPAVDGVFEAVGAIKAQVLAGAEADVVILTSAAIADLAAKGILDGSSVAALGVVRAGLAVRNADAAPPLSSVDDLRAALLAADAIFIPDPVQATSGIHFAKVLDTLGIKDKVADRLRIFPQGSMAMHELASSGAERPLGFTQVSEIIETAGVSLASLLPAEFELATVYSAGVAVRAPLRSEAETFVARLSGREMADIRIEAGFTQN